MARIVHIDPARVRRGPLLAAAAAVRRGGVIVYPTDTIYGLGCDALNTAAAARIVRIKRRPEGKAALVLVRNVSMVRALVREIPGPARVLMRKFWPGPLTMVFAARPGLGRAITSPDGGIALRIPGNRFCLELIREAGRPIVSTSANISGDRAPDDPEALKRLFQRKVDLIVDAGRLPQSLASTVIDVRAGAPTVVREGAIRWGDILGALSANQ